MLEISEFNTAETNFVGLSKRQAKRNKRSKGKIYGHLRRIKRNLVYAAYNQQCYLCGKCLQDKEEKQSLEHITPLSIGGTSTLFNLALACKRCNSVRSSVPLECYIELDHNRNPIHTELKSNLVISRIKRGIDNLKLIYKVHYTSAFSDKNKAKALQELALVEKIINDFEAEKEILNNFYSEFGGEC